jgi:hypothetical protein
VCQKWLPVDIQMKNEEEEEEEDQQEKKKKRGTLCLINI